MVNSAIRLPSMPTSLSEFYSPFKQVDIMEFTDLDPAANAQKLAASWSREWLIHVTSMFRPYFETQIIQDKDVA